MKSHSSRAALLVAALAAFAASPALSKTLSKSSLPQVMQVARPPDGEWFGVYVLGQKAGYSFTDVRWGTFQGRQAIVEVATSVLKVTVGGTEATRSISEERYFEPKDGGRLLGFKVEHKGDGGNEVLLGTCSDKGIDLVRKRPGRPDEKRVMPPTAETVENADAPRLVARSGKRFDGIVVDAEDTVEDKKTWTELVGPGVFQAAGVSIPVIRTRTFDEKDKLPAETVLGPDGRVLEVRFGEAMVAKAEPKAVAQKLDKVDLFGLTRVVLAGPVERTVLEPPSEIRWLVTGLAKDARKESYRQSFAELSGGEVRMTIQSRLPKARAQRPVASGSDSELREALKATMSVESDAPSIVETAKKIAGDEKDAWAVARRVNLFVYSTVEKTYGASADRATDVLSQRKGDCTEHSLLMTALLRAAGIPARRVDGLVYMEASDGIPALYWHEWVEAYVGEWVAMDPTLGQPVADPTHIALGGEGRSETAGLIGQLHFRVEKSSQ